MIGNNFNCYDFDYLHWLDKKCISYIEKNSKNCTQHPLEVELRPK